MRVETTALQQLKQLILDKTQGTPFFMEEIVQELVEQGVLVRTDVGATHASPLPTDLHIPPTVQGILSARIDRLAPDEKSLLQQLAVIGRQFPLSLIRQVIAQPEAELYRLLASLQHKEFLYEQPAFPESEYLFKHALTQEVAYGTVLQEQRKAQHEKIAQAIETLYHANFEDHYGALAHHYQLSGNMEKAVVYLHLAGQQAVQRSANEEAMELLTTALALLKMLPDTPQRIRQELTLQVTLGVPLLATRGWGSPELEQVYLRARELCLQIDDSSYVFPVLWGLWGFYISRPVVGLARELAEQLFSLASAEQAPNLLLPAHYALGAILFNLGEFTGNGSDAPKLASFRFLG